MTGAAGTLGRVLRAHLARMGDVTVRLTDRVDGGDPAIVRADLAVPSPVWERLFERVDAVIHLAANGRPAAEWSDLIAPNIDVPLNIYRVAAAHDVRHMVLASSIWASAARRRDRGTITAEQSDPGTNSYGASKLFAERIALAFWRSDRVASTILRIGAYSPDHNQMRLRPGWDLEARLSPRDLCAGIECAIRSTPLGVRTLNLISHNKNARFTLHEAREALGYVPEDRFEISSDVSWLQPVLRRLKHISWQKPRAKE